MTSSLTYQFNLFSNIMAGNNTRTIDAPSVPGPPNVHSIYMILPCSRTFASCSRCRTYNFKPRLHVFHTSNPHTVLLIYLSIDQLTCILYRSSSSILYRSSSRSDSPAYCQPTSQPASQIQYQLVGIWQCSEDYIIMFRRSAPYTDGNTRCLFINPLLAHSEYKSSVSLVDTWSESYE